MSLQTGQILTAPRGMSTAIPRSLLKENRCEYLSGVYPARYGKQRLVPLPKLLSVFSFPIQNLAYWMSSDGQWDTLLIMSDSTVGGAGPSDTDIYTARLYYSSGTTPAFDYDELMDKQRSKLTLAATVKTDSSSGISPPPIVRQTMSVQFKTELIWSGRYYRTEPTGTEKFFVLGLPTPAAPTGVSSTVAGTHLTLLATYSWLITWVDEMGRESSPGAILTKTLTGTEDKVTLTRPTLNSDGVSWNVYRRNPGSATFVFVATVAVGTTTYADDNTDSSIAQNDAAPDAGQNDVPSNFNIFTVWKDRLVTNDLSNLSNVQVSNAGSPTQFSSLSLPTNVADGFRAWVGGKGDNEITGFASLGSMLGIFKRSSMTFLQGDTIENFSLLPIHERGCANPFGVQRCENEIIFPSNDGMYSVVYESGYIVKKLSEEVEDLFSGFTETKRETEPRSFGQPKSTEIVLSKTGWMNSWYSRNIYYISFANKTLGFDVITRGWFDTRWGFIPYFAGPYKSQNSDPDINGAPPETIFIARGDLNSGLNSQNFVKNLEYITAVDTPWDTDAQEPLGGQVIGYEITRYFDGDGPPQKRTKRAKRFALWGETSAKPGRVIGKLYGYADGDLRCIYPIRAYQRIEKNNALFEQEFNGLLAGEVIYFKIEWTYPDVQIENRALLYIFTS